MNSSVGFLFPGQGSQFVGMGRELASNHPEAQELFDRAKQILGYDLSKICFEGPEDQLTRTLYAQPAIFVMSLAAHRALLSKIPGIQPAFSAGLSLGEFTALTAVGSLRFDDGLRLVKERAEAMEESATLNPGTMASVMGLDQAACELIAKEAGCEVANLNSPDQIVLSGKVEAIETACVLAESRGAKRALRLKVGGAFHSSLMAHAKDRLQKALAATEIAAPKGVFIPNVLGTPVSDPAEIRNLLARQLTSSVQWIKTMQAAAQTGISTFIEIGPGKVLKGLAKKTAKELRVETVGTPEDLNAITSVFAQV